MTVQSISISACRFCANKLLHFYPGCIKEQLQSLRQGFNSLIPDKQLKTFSPHELEVILSGQPVIDIDFIKRRANFSGHGYTQQSQVVQWLWEVLESFTQVQWLANSD